MPDIDLLRGQLKSLLTKPEHKPLFEYHNRFLGPRDTSYDPDSVSDRSAKSIVNDHAMIDPIEIVELKGYVELYRAHDGGRSRTTTGPLAKNRPVPKSAQTLGRYWWDRPTMQAMWDAAASREKDNEKRKALFFGFLRAGNFVLPEWNAMTQIVCMAVPSGKRLVVARGRGSWEAMQTPAGSKRLHGEPSISTPGDVFDHLKMMPIPGTTQYFVPLFSDLWVTSYNARASWPFYT